MKSSVQEILNRPYARVLIRNEDGSYTAQILEFPGCVAEGETPNEAMNDLDEAASSWIEVAIEQNDTIPEPLANYGYSGKINLRIPKTIHKQAARFAQKDDVSLNQFFNSAIAARVGVEDFCERLINRITEDISKRTTISCFQYQWTSVSQIPFGSFIRLGSNTYLTESKLQPMQQKVISNG